MSTCFRTRAAAPGEALGERLTAAGAGRGGLPAPTFGAGPHVQGRPACGTSTRATRMRPSGLARRLASMKSGAAAMNNVRPSGPPSAAAKMPSSPVSICSRMRRRHAHDALADGVGHPQRALGVQRAAVRTDGRGGDQRVQVVRGRQRAEVGPVAARAEAAVGQDVEFRDAIAEGLVDDQGLAVGRDEGAVGKHSPSATARAEPSGSTRTTVVVATGSPAIRSKPKLPRRPAPGRRPPCH